MRVNMGLLSIDISNIVQSVEHKYTKKKGLAEEVNLFEAGMNLESDSTYIVQNEQADIANEEDNEEIEEIQVKKKPANTVKIELHQVEEVKPVKPQDNSNSHVKDILYDKSNRNNISKPPSGNKGAPIIRDEFESRKETVADRPIIKQPEISQTRVLPKEIVVNKPVSEVKSQKEEPSLGMTLLEWVSSKGGEVTLSEALKYFTIKQINKAVADYEVVKYHNRYKGEECLCT